VRISRIQARVGDLSQNAKTPELRSDAARVRDAVSDASGLPSDGPFSRASATMVVLEDPDQTVPKPSASLRSELAPRLDKPGEFLLPFRHFTIAMHARRRLPVFAAINLDGKKMPDGAIFSWVSPSNPTAMRRNGTIAGDHRIQIGEWTPRSGQWSRSQNASGPSAASRYF
jgi:hypothetical protein